MGQILRDGSLLRDILVSGAVLLLAEETNRRKNCCCCICCYVYTGSAAALGGAVSGKNPLDGSRNGNFRDLFCVVAVSILCPGQFDWPDMDEDTGKKVNSKVRLSPPFYSENKIKLLMGNSG
jgi:hypothetical protein